MKVAITEYIFNATAKTITLTGITVNLGRVLVIKNLSTGAFIYRVTDPTLTISAAGSVITFTANNMGMNNGDSLFIQYDLEVDYATEAKQDAILAELQGKTEPGNTQLVNTGLTQPLTDDELRATPVSVILSGGATEAKQNDILTALDTLQTELELKAKVSDTQPVSVSSIALPTGASTAALQTAQSTLLGNVVETAPVTDVASSGLNGRLQRIAQRLTSLISLFPTSLGTKTAKNSLAVTHSVEASFFISARTIATSTDKSMICIKNNTGSLVKLEICSVKIKSNPTGGNNSINEFFFERHPAVTITGGTVITPVACDSTDILNGSISVVSGGTFAASPTVLKTVESNNVAMANNNTASSDHTQQEMFPYYHKEPSIKAITLNANEMFNIRFVSSNFTAAFDIEIVFNQQ